MKHTNNTNYNLRKKDGKTKWKNSQVNKKD